MSAPVNFNVYQNTTFTLTLRNVGGATATGIAVKFPFPTSFVYGGVNTSSAGTTYDTYFQTWTVPSLAAGATVTMTLTLFNLTASVPIKAFAQVTACATPDVDRRVGMGFYARHCRRATPCKMAARMETRT